MAFPNGARTVEIALSNDEQWLYFRYQYIETGWFDYDGYKTIAVMQKLSERLPEDVLYSLPPLVVFAPSATKLGEVKPFGLGDRLLLYLSPRLEAKPQSEVDFTLAHEFAHISPGHHQPGATAVPPGAVVQNYDVPSEQDTDRLAESWGFALPKVGRNNRKRNKCLVVEPSLGRTARRSLEAGALTASAPLGRKSLGRL